MRALMDGFRIGDRVRMPNGKTGTVLKVARTRIFVHPDGPGTDNYIPLYPSTLIRLEAT